MSNYLHHLAERVSSAPTGVRPALPSLFEPVTGESTLREASLAGERGSTFRTDIEAEPRVEKSFVAPEPSIHDRLLTAQSLLTNAAPAQSAPKQNLVARAANGVGAESIAAPSIESSKHVVENGLRAGQTSTEEVKRPPPLVRSSVSSQSSPSTKAESAVTYSHSEPVVSVVGTSRPAPIGPEIVVTRQTQHGSQDSAEAAEKPPLVGSPVAARNSSNARAEPPPIEPVIRVAKNELHTKFASTPSPLEVPRSSATRTTSNEGAAPVVQNKLRVSQASTNANEQPPLIGSPEPLRSSAKAKPETEPARVAPQLDRNRPAAIATNPAPTRPAALPALPAPPSPLSRARIHAQAGTGSAEHAFAPSPPTIHVTIGRIEVRAITAPTTPVGVQSTSVRARVPKLSLDDYLRVRNGGKRRE